MKRWLIGSIIIGAFISGTFVTINTAWYKHQQATMFVQSEQGERINSFLSNQLKNTSEYLSLITDFEYDTNKKIARWKTRNMKLYYTVTDVDHIEEDFRREEYAQIIIYYRGDKIPKVKN